jgi:quinol monooxygenase YgiN
MATTTLVISGEIGLHPDDFDDALALIGPHVTAVNEQPGCIAYDFWVDPRDRGRIRLFEEWESEATNAAYAGSDLLAGFMAGMAKLRITKLDLSRYEIASKESL